MHQSGRKRSWVSRKDLAVVAACGSTGMGEPPQEWKGMEEIMGTAEQQQHLPQPQGASLSAVLTWLGRASGARQDVVVSQDVLGCKHQPSSPQSCRNQRLWVVPLGLLFSSSVFSQSPEIYFFFPMKTVIPCCCRPPDAGFLREPTVFQV